MHIGTGKAGSTSIQNSLHLSRKALLELGILVPTNQGRRITQTELCEIIVKNVRTLQQEKLLEDIDSQVTKYKPNYVIFSSEYMAANEIAARNIESFANRWSSSFRVVLFLREPISFYRSLQQQRLKGDYRIQCPTSWMANYRTMVEMWSRRVGENLRIIPFQKSAIGDGGVTLTFLKSVTEVNGLPQAINEVHSNLSEPAEVSQIMQEYFSILHPDEPRKRRADSDFVRRTLSELASRLKVGTKAEVVSNIADMIYANNASDMCWLNDEFGIKFDGIDYDELKILKSTSSTQTFSDVEDIFRTNDADLKLLRNAASQAFAQKLLGQKSAGEIDEKYRVQIAQLKKDAAARRSWLAFTLDKLDYQSHKFLGSLTLATPTFRSRMNKAAAARYRKCYDSEKKLDEI